jgi:hypothetical protein
MIKPLEEIADYCRDIRTALEIVEYASDRHTLVNCNEYIRDRLELILSDVQHIDEHITKLESKP